MLELAPIVLKHNKRPLVIRFSVHRKTYRNQTGATLTKSEWIVEQQKGYPNTKNVIEIQDKAIEILSSMELSTFDIKVFRELMNKPVIKTDSITRWWTLYDDHRDRKSLAIRTRGLAMATKKKLDEYFADDHRHMDNIHAWNAEELDIFQQWLVDRPLAIDTAKIYLEQFRTFFTWMVDDKEMVIRSPFRKYTIPHSEENWFPYSESELKKIFSVEPANPKDELALKWTKLILFSGGSDSKDFAEMKWRQMKDEAVHVVRQKAKKSCKSSSKLVYLTESVREVFGELQTENHGPDEYVFPIYKKGNTDSQNLECL